MHQEIPRDKLDRHFVSDATFVLDSSVEGRNPRRIDGTRVSELKSIQDWYRDDQGQAIYWLDAMSGTGKSTIARTVAAALTLGTNVEDNNEAPNHIFLAASFFFSRGDTSRNTTRNLFPTIASSLATRRPDTRQYIAEAARELGNLESSGFLLTWDLLIRDPLLKYAADMKSPERWVVIIDALDECQSTGDILPMLSRLGQGSKLGTGPLQIRFLITSRPERHIKDAFSKLHESQVRSSMLEKVAIVDSGSKLLEENDIKTFLRVELARVAAERTPKDHGWPGEDAIRQLTIKTEGLFIYADTCCRFIDHPLAKERLDEVLKGTDEALGPQGSLFAIYNTVLRHPMEVCTKKEMQKLGNILGPIVVLAEPVSVPTLAQLLPKQDLNDCGQLSARLADLHSVISVPENANDPVKLHHLSFQNFLVDPKTQQSHPHFWINAKEMHSAMLKRCLDILKEDLQEQDICHVRLPGCPVSQLSPAEIQKHIPLHLQYACRHWVHHVSHLDLGSEVASEIYDFLHLKFLYWLEATSWIQEMPASITMFIQLQEMLKCVEARAATRGRPRTRRGAGCHQDGAVAQLAVFVKDAHRFLLSNRSIIERAPLQIYSSALVFSPTESVVRKTFGRTGCGTS